jgi:hypothetical protein
MVLNICLWTAYITSTTTVRFGKEIATFWTIVIVFQRGSPKWTSGYVLEYRFARSIPIKVFPSVVSSSIFARDRPDEVARVGCPRVLERTRRKINMLA